MTDPVAAIDPGTSAAAVVFTPVEQTLRLGDLGIARENLRYGEPPDDDIPTLVHAVMTNEQMWGQDLTKVPGFEEATVKNLTNIRENGALAAYASCL